MKTEHLSLDDGIIEIVEDMVIISDKAKQNRIIEILLIISSLCYGIPIAIKGFKDKDYFFFVVGLIMTVLYIYEIIQQIKKGVFSNRLYISRVPIQTISSVTFQGNRFGFYLIGKISLENKKYREIRTTPKYMQESNFIETLKSKGINVAV